MLKDLRYAIRTLLRRPGFLLVAVSTLALGIGATTAMFTVVNSVLLRPLQFPEPERIVLFQSTNLSMGIKQSNISVPDAVDWQQQSTSFEQMAKFVTFGTFIVTGGETERVRTAAVTVEFFPVMFTVPISGRTIQPADIPGDSGNVAVISYALWQQRFGGAADVNRTITVNTTNVTILGIMPPGFNYPADSEIWILWLVEQIKAVPGVQAAGGTLSLPLMADEFNLGRGVQRSVFTA